MMLPRAIGLAILWIAVAHLFVPILPLPVLPGAPNRNDLFTLVALLAIVAAALNSNLGPDTRDPLRWAVVLYLGAAVVSSWANGGLTASGIAILGYGVWYWAVRRVLLSGTPRDVIRTLALVGAAASFVSAIAVSYHAAVGLSERIELYPPVWQWGGYPEIGLVSMVGTIVLGGYLAEARQNWQVVSGMLLLFITLLNLTTLYARASMVGTLVGAVVFLTAWWKRPRQIVWRAAFMLPALALIVAVLAATGVTRKAVSLGTAALEDRLEIWTTSWRVVRQHPLLGIGPGRFETHFKAAADPEWLRAHTWGRGVHAHNLFLHTWAEGGIVSLGAMIALFVLGIGLCWRRAREGSGAGCEAAIIAACLAAFLVRAQTDIVMSELETPVRINFLLWLLLALASATETLPRTAAARQPLTQFFPLSGKGRV